MKKHKSKKQAPITEAGKKSNIEEMDKELLDKLKEETLDLGFKYRQMGRYGGII